MSILEEYGAFNEVNKSHIYKSLELFHRSYLQVLGTGLSENWTVTQTYLLGSCELHF